MSTLITGASGQLAAGVIDEVLKTMPASEIIVVTRTPERLTPLADIGVTVRQADFADPSTLSAALDGATRMLLISADVVGVRVGQHRAAITAAESVGVESIVYTSIVNPVPANPAVVVPDHIATERDLTDSGVGWVILRNSVYADIQAREMANAAATGRLVTNQGNGSASYVTRADCARAAASALIADFATGRVYDITGPDAVSADRRAAIFTSITGAPIEVVEVDDETYARGVSETTGIPLEQTRAFATFGEAVRGGWFEVVSGDFETLTGSQSQALLQFLEGV